MSDSAPHVLQSSYETLRRNGAFDEVRLILKREKGSKVSGLHLLEFVCAADAGCHIAFICLRRVAIATTLKPEVSALNTT